MNKVTILGGGSWGTTLANLLAEKNIPTNLWVRDKKNFILTENRIINKKYLPNYKLSRDLNVLSNIEKALEDVDLLVFAVPSKNFRKICTKVSKLLKNQKILIATKGIENDSFLTMSEVFLNETNYIKKNIMVLSGPNIADEIMKKHVSASVVAGENKTLLNQVSKLFNTEYFKIFISKDLKGVEMSGALKNLYAIFSGLSDGLGYESNTKAMLLTRSLSEMSDLYQKINANPKTLLGLSGVGDLIATSSSQKSRNYSFGRYLGEGNTPQKALKKINQSVEGYRTLKVVNEKNKKLSLKMPIIEALYEIVYEKKDPKKCFLKFMRESDNIDTPNE